MRSTEASGVGKERFRAADRPSQQPPFIRLLLSISPVTYAVAITALIAATLFVTSDAVRSNDEAQRHQALVARLAAAAPSGMDADNDNGAGQRAAIAFGLALLAAGLSFRRRPPLQPVAELNSSYVEALTSIREEQRVLARRYHEEKLRAEAASRAKTSFLAHLSHDIRTPLNAIIGFAELMHHQTYGPLGDAHYAGYVESIRSSGDRLLGFFATILDLAELEGGRRTLEQSPLGADDLLVSVARRYGGRALRARVQLTLGAPCGAALLGDRFSLERMLGNLVDNALRFTRAGGRVTLAAYAAADGVVLEVTDTGIGMDSERLAALSQPFAFGDAALTRDHEGAGLGIAISRAIAELSGGRLAIDSRPGLGTTVAISLPLLEGGARIEQAA